MNERVLFYYDGWMIRVFCSGLPLILRLLELAKRKERWLLHKIHHMRHDSAIKREDLKSWMGTRRVTLLRGHGVGWPGRSGIFIINLIVNVLRNNTNWGGARVWNFTREGESGRDKESFDLYLYSCKNKLKKCTRLLRLWWFRIVNKCDCTEYKNMYSLTYEGEFFYRREHEKQKTRERKKCGDWLKGGIYCTLLCIAIVLAH